MNSQHFPIKMYGAYINAWGSKFDIEVKRSNVNEGPLFKQFG